MTKRALIKYLRNWVKRKKKINILKQDEKLY